MLHLLYSIILIITLISFFKLFSFYKINALQTVVVNYFVCVVTGYSFQPISLNEISLEWLPFSVLIGAIFFFAFLLIGVATPILGVSTVSVASKTSMIIPLISAVFILKIDKSFNFFYISAIVLSLSAVILTSIKPKSKIKLSRKYIFYPAAIFLLTGISDSLLNFVNMHYLTHEKSSAFATSLFFFSGIFGLLFLSYELVINKIKFEIKSVLAGIMLGIPNYFSIYFLIKAIEDFNNDGTYLFPINNIGIILGSTLVGIIFFKEKLSLINFLGILLAILSIFFLTF